MSEIKPWRDRVPKDTTSFDYPRVCRETADAEIAELRAALAKVEQGEPVEVQGRPAENFSFMVVDPKDADDLIKCGWEIRKLFTHPVRTMSDEPRYTVDQIADAACHAEVNDSKFESMCVYLGGIKGATA